VIDNQPVTVVYGHLSFASVAFDVNDPIEQGDVIGMLGKGYSSETGGERKHLHLGIHKGTTINIRGYVGSKRELSNWIDVCSLFCKAD
jgi:murein DD-endopeptidase MepM/ murein hydrolase activator NlpD